VSEYYNLSAGVHEQCDLRRLRPGCPLRIVSIPDRGPCLAGGRRLAAFGYEWPTARTPRRSRRILCAVSAMACCLGFARFALLPIYFHAVNASRPQEYLGTVSPRAQHPVLSSLADAMAAASLFLAAEPSFLVTALSVRLSTGWPRLAASSLRPDAHGGGALVYARL